jgi:uncharacterized protein YqgV (UPF0045/DUF77 family)
MQPEASPTPGEGDSARDRMKPDALEQVLEARFDEWLRAIQDTANQLMHEVASEIWRAAGGDKDQTGSRILESISRDQGMRSLIAHADERFQSLAVRTARLEDTMNTLVDSIRQAKDELSRGVDILHEVRAEDAGAEGFGDVRTQLDQVSEQIAVAFRTLTERDRAIVETVQAQIRGHGELITQEAGRIAQAMEAYVQAGVAAMGQLAGSVEAQMSAMGSVSSQDELGEQLQLIYERMAIDATSVNETLSHLLDRNDAQIRDLSEQVQLVHERVTIDTRELATALQTRVLGLARLTRSDSQKLRTAMTSDAHGLRAEIDELRSAIAELGTTAGEGAAQALDAKIAGLARLVRSDNEKLAEQIASDQEASKQALRAMKELQASLPVEVIDSVERRMETLAESVQKANEMLAQRIDRMAEKIGERQDSDIQVVIDRMGDAMHALAGLGRGGDAGGSGGGVGTPL